MTVLYIISDSNNPYHNLAIERQLLHLASDDNALLYLWQNDNTIVVGKNQHVQSEINVSQFLQAGGHIARRYSGGGTVYHDMGNLCYSFICSEKNIEKFRYYKWIPEVLKSFSLNVEYNDRNDLLIEGRKFSGNSVYNNGTTICQHGTFLVHTDLKRMSRFLTPSSEKLNRNYVSSVSARVMNLTEKQPGLTVEMLADALILNFNGGKLEYNLDCPEMVQLERFFSSSDWIYQGKS